MHPIYLDNASTSFPKPACVPDAVYRSYDRPAAQCLARRLPLCLQRRGASF